MSMYLWFIFLISKGHMENKPNLMLINIKINDFHKTLPVSKYSIQWGLSSWPLVYKTSALTFELWWRWIFETLITKNVCQLDRLFQIYSTTFPFQGIFKLKRFAHGYFKHFLTVIILLLQITLSELLTHCTFH